MQWEKYDKSNTEIRKLYLKYNLKQEVKLYRSIVRGKGISTTILEGTSREKRRERKKLKMLREEDIKKIKEHAWNMNGWRQQ